MNKKKITTDAQILAKEYTAFIADSRKSLSGFTIKGYDDTMRALKKSSRYEDFSIINKKADCT